MKDIYRNLIKKVSHPNTVVVTDSFYLLLLLIRDSRKSFLHVGYDEYNISSFEYRDFRKVFINNFDEVECFFILMAAFKDVDDNLLYLIVHLTFIYNNDFNMIDRCIYNVLYLRKMNISNYDSVLEYFENYKIDNYNVDVNFDGTYGFKCYYVTDKDIKYLKDNNLKKFITIKNSFDIDRCLQKKFFNKYQYFILKNTNNYAKFLNEVIHNHFYYYNEEFINFDNVIFLIKS